MLAIPLKLWYSDIKKEAVRKAAVCMEWHNAWENPSESCSGYRYRFWPHAKVADPEDNFGGSRYAEQSGSPQMQRRWIAGVDVLSDQRKGNGRRSSLYGECRTQQRKFAEVNWWEEIYWYRQGPLCLCRKDISRRWLWRSIVFRAKTTELRTYYMKAFGAVPLGQYDPFRMIIWEDAAYQLISEYRTVSENG